MTNINRQIIPYNPYNRIIQLDGYYYYLVPVNHIHHQDVYDDEQDEDWYDVNKAKKTISKPNNYIYNYSKINDTNNETQWNYIEKSKQHKTKHYKYQTSNDYNLSNVCNISCDISSKQDTTTLDSKYFFKANNKSRGKSSKKKKFSSSDWDHSYKGFIHALIPSDISI